MGMMEGFGYLSIIEYHTPLCHHEVGIIQLMILVALHLVFHMVMVNMVWVLVPPTFPPKQFTVGLMVCGFVSSRSIDYQSMSHFNKFRYSYLLSWESCDLFSDDGNGRGSVGPRTTHLSSLKVDLGTDRHDSYF